MKTKTQRNVQNRFNRKCNFTEHTVTVHGVHFLLSGQIYYYTPGGEGSARPYVHCLLYVMYDRIVIILGDTNALFIRL